MATERPRIRVSIPQALRPFCPSELSFEANTVRELLSELARDQPQVHIRLCNETGEPRKHINVFVNDDHIRARDGLDTRLASGDFVTILPAVSGG